MTNEAYTDVELMSLLADQGLTAVTDVGPLPGSTGDNAMTALVGHAAESAKPQNHRIRPQPAL